MPRIHYSSIPTEAPLMRILAIKPKNRIWKPWLTIPTLKFDLQLYSANPTYRPIQRIWFHNSFSKLNLQPPPTIWPARLKDQSVTICYPLLPPIRLTQKSSLQFMQGERKACHKVQDSFTIRFSANRELIPCCRERAPSLQLRWKGGKKKKSSKLGNIVGFLPAEGKVHKLKVKRE